MKRLSTIALALSILLGLMFGAQTRDWSWGPAFVALGVAVMASLGVREREIGRGIWWSILPIAAWILFRASQSPVWDLARTDGMLVLGVLGTAWVTTRLRPGDSSVTLLFGSLAVVLLSNLLVAAVQYFDSGFVWPYPRRPALRPSGFFGHYNYFSNFSFGLGLVLMARSLFSRDHAAWRCFFAAVAVFAAVMVVLSGSRGGTLALGVGVVVLIGCAGVLTWRDGARSWQGKVTLIALPLLLVGALLGGFLVFSKVVENRGGNKDWVQLADNTSRLEWMDLALGVAGDHWLQGGGSRAFSWERNQHWDYEEMNQGSENEPFVHNEWLQTLADYGLIGGVLVLMPLATLVWVAMARLFLGGDRPDRSRDAVAAGILAATVAMVLQANASFVFHLLPSTLLLGMLLGLGSWLTLPQRSQWRWPGLAGAGAMAALMLVLGVQATRALHAAWPVLYREPSLAMSDPERALDRLARAAEVWPGFQFHELTGEWARLIAAESDHPASWNERAAAAYREAAKVHRHHPGLEINLANTLSELDEWDGAVPHYRRAIELQGGLEAAFSARFFYASHLYRAWHARWMEERRSGEALWYFEEALKVLALSEAEAPLWGGDLGKRKADRDELRRQLEASVRFLRDAKVEPIPPAGVVEISE